jgi:hypothetical protein
MLDISFLYKMKEWLMTHQQKILLLIGVLLVGILAFESGFLRGKIAQSEPIVLTIPAVAEAQVTTKDAGNASAEGKPQGVEQVVSVSSEKPSSTNCPLVGSRNSNKYHVATCAVVKRIKPENRVCFSSKEDAEKRGYVVGCLK